MNEDKFKKILDQALEPIRTDLGSVKQDLGSVKSDLKNVTAIVEKVNNTQENQVLPSVINTEAVLKGYADAYKINKGNIERLDERVAKFEEDANVIVPPELAIQR